MNTFRIFAAFLVLLAGTGCKLPRCSELFRVGARYQATVLEPLSISGRFPAPPPVRSITTSCAALDGIKERTVITLEMTSWNEDGNCAAPVGRIVSAPAEVTLQSTGGPGNDGAAILAAASLANVGNCSGLWSVSYYRGESGNDQVLGAATVGKPPPAIIIRRFFPASESASPCTICEDAFAVTLEQVSP